MLTGIPGLRTPALGAFGAWRTGTTIGGVLAPQASPAEARLPILTSDTLVWRTALGWCPGWLRDRFLWELENRSGSCRGLHGICPKRGMVVVWDSSHSWSVTYAPKARSRSALGLAKMGVKE